MDLPQLITAAPNLAFGLICLWFVREIQKERVAEGARYAASLEKINELYIQLLEKAVTAIASNASLSASNGDAITKLLAEFAAFRAEIGGLRDNLNRLIRDGAKRDQGNSRGISGGSASD